MKRSKQVAKDRFWGMTKQLRQAFNNVNPKVIKSEIEKAIVDVRATKKSRKA